MILHCWFTPIKAWHWSDNTFRYPLSIIRSCSGAVVFLQNGWFVPVISELSGYKIVGLLRLSAHYGIENDIISDGLTES